MNGKKLSTECVTASSVNMFKNKVDTSVLRGPGFGSKPGPARSPRAGPLHNFAGRAWAYILRARAGPRLKTI